MTDVELRRIRDHAAANPSHAGDAVLRLVAEVERLTRERDAYLFMLTPKSADDLWYAATGRADPFVVSWTALELDGPWHDRADAIVAVRKKAGLDAAPTERETR